MNWVSASFTSLMLDGSSKSLFSLGENRLNMNAAASFLIKCHSESIEYSFHYCHYFLSPPKRQPSAPKVIPFLTERRKREQGGKTRRRLTTLQTFFQQIKISYHHQATVSTMILSEVTSNFNLNDLKYHLFNRLFHPNNCSQSFYLRRVSAFLAFNPQAISSFFT